MSASLETQVLMNLLDSVIEKLGPYYGVPSRDVLADRLKMLTENTDSDSASNEFTTDKLDNIISAFIRPSSTMMLGEAMNELQDLFVDLTGPALKDMQIRLARNICVTTNWHAKVENVKHPLVNRYNKEIVAGTGFMQGTTEDEGKIAKVNDMYPPDAVGSLSDSPENASRRKPVVAVVQIFDSRRTLKTRNSGMAQIFFNGIPPVEINRCMPYFNMTLISPEKSIGIEGNLQGTSLLKSLMGDVMLSGDSTTDNTDVLAMIASARDVRALNLFGVDVGTGLSDAGAIQSTAGMELFTSPQTLVPLDKLSAMTSYNDSSFVNHRVSMAGHAEGLDDTRILQGSSARAVSVLDPFLPVASIENFQVDVEAAVRALTVKRATITVIVHDRSRLHELAPLIRPDYYARPGGTRILIEYGWSHPEGSVNSHNLMGQFLNSLKIQDVFSVVNSTMTMQSDGSLRINVSLVSYGGKTFDTLTIASSPEVAKDQETLDKLVQAMNEITRRVGGRAAKGKSINATSFINSVRSTSAALTISSDLKEEIEEFVGAVGEESSTDNKKLKDILVDLYGEKPTKGTGGLISKFKKTTVGESIRKKMDKIGSSPDPFLRESEGLKIGFNKKYIKPKIDVNTPRRRAGKKVERNYISLGKLLSVFIGTSLSDAKLFEEIQFLYYSVNSKAGFVRDLNMSQFPIHINDFKKFYAKQISHSGNDLTLGAFMVLVKNYLVSNQSSRAYGLNNLYTSTTDGYQLKHTYQQATRLDNEINQRMRAAYGTSNVGNDVKAAAEENEFILPDLSWYMEVIPRTQTGSSSGESTRKQESILRLHIYDTVNSSFKTAGKLLNAALDNQIGVISAGAKSIGDENDPCQHVAEYINTINTAVKLGLAVPLNPELAGKKLTAMQIVQEKFTVNSGYQKLKEFITLCVPTIKYGNNASVITSLNLATQNNTLMNAISVKRAFRTGESAPPGYAEGSLPMQIAPMRLSLTTLGNPFLEFGQEYFIDLQTGTSADGMYLCNRVSHQLSSQGFETSMEFINMQTFGKYRSVQQDIEDSLQLIKNLDIDEQN